MQAMREHQKVVQHLMMLNDALGERLGGEVPDELVRGI